mgnify:FL=1
MWSKGSIEIDGTEVQYWVKHFEEGSEWGIDGGRISKLECRANGKTILSYDRGWDMEPETELDYQAFAILTERFN